MGGRLNYSGLVVAGTGFFLTRFTVTLTLYEEPLRFYLAGVVPLALGLGLAAFGIALTVADVDAGTVRTTAVWCLVGAGTMLVLVVLTLLGSTEGMTDLGVVRSRTYLANFLIGGSVGGTLTGLYAARNRRQRDALRQQTNRLVVLNRLLRHEVLNSVAVIRGYAPAAGESDRAATADRDPSAVITDRADAIVETIEDVKYLTRGAGGVAHTEPTSLAPVIRESVERIEGEYPDVSVRVEGDASALSVRANDRLVELLVELLENAVVHGGDDAPTIGVNARGRQVAVTVRDGGPGLPPDQHSLLESGDIEEFDSTGTGFGLNVVRLLVENYGGRIRTGSARGTPTDPLDARGGSESEPARATADGGDGSAVESGDGGGTTITVLLHREEDSGVVSPTAADLAAVRPALPHLLVTLGAALIAGVVYGASAILQGGSIAGIGFLYGAADPTVGWLTHEFHSVVFGFAFVGLLSILPVHRRDRLSTYLIGGLVWGIVLWLIAASVVAPVWLRLLGTPAPVPSFSVDLLINHVLWGLSLGLLVMGGYRYVVPALSRLSTPIDRGLDAISGRR